jgi:antitoxin FitA
MLALHRTEVVGMATLTIRDLDDAVKARLRVRAAHNGRSMEAEARAILRAALTEAAAQRGLGSRIRQRFADLGDLGDAAIEVPPRTEKPRAADFTE